VKIVVYDDTWKMISLKRQLIKLEANVVQLEKQLCPKCRQKFSEIFEKKE